MNNALTKYQIESKTVVKVSNHIIETKSVNWHNQT